MRQFMSSSGTLPILGVVMPPSLQQLALAPVVAQTRVNQPNMALPTRDTWVIFTNRFVGRCLSVSTDGQHLLVRRLLPRDPSDLLGTVWFYPPHNGPRWVVETKYILDHGEGLLTREMRRNRTFARRVESATILTSLSAPVFISFQQWSAARGEPLVEVAREAGVSSTDASSSDGEDPLEDILEVDTGRGVADADMSEPDMDSSMSDQY
jgi:hypothetical protein